MAELRFWVPAAILAVAIVVAVTIIAVGFRFSPASPARPVKVSSSEWAPYVGAELPRGGPLTELVTEVLSGAGYEPTVSYTSWSRATGAMTSGGSIGIYPMVGSEERRQNFLLSDSLMEFEYGLFYDRRAGEPVINTAADVAKLRVGSIAGYDYWDELDDAVDEYVEFDTALLGLEALADGQIDVLAEGLLSGQAALNEPAFSADASDFSHIESGNPLVLSVESLYFMMENNAESAAVMADFNVSLAAVKKGSDYGDIVAGVGGTRSDEIALLPAEHSGLVELLDSAGAVQSLAPRGTTAIVLEWPDAFFGIKQPADTVPLVSVKITSGPSQGRIVYVDARSVSLGVSGE